MITDFGLCHIYEETNSVEESLALLSFDDFGGDIPWHLVHVGRFFRLLPFLVAWAQGFWVGQQLLVWVAVFVLASMGAPSLAMCAMATSCPWSWGLGRSLSAA